SGPVVVGALAAGGAAGAVSGGTAGSEGEGGVPGLEATPQPLGIEEAMDQLIELRTVEGRVRASSIRRLGDMVDQYPDEAIDILRSWLYEEAA
ncbi:flagellar M-ring protein FliF, partial [Azospirillum doebereinerae]|nr:flagellar M-ring protein FliF [Azospirillum doebereinerae]